MKIRYILIGLFLLTGIFVSAQSPDKDTLTRYYSKYPQQAVQDAEKMYQKAVKTHDRPLLIKALIQKTVFTLKTDSDKYPQCIRELENYTEKETHPDLKSLLHSYIGQLYFLYYHSHRLQIDSRSEIVGTVPEQMEAWSSNLFRERIFRHLQASIAGKQQLQETPVSEYKTILKEGEASDSLRPTLYDFLCHRAIDLLSRLRQEQSPFPCGTPELLADAGDFLKMSVTAHNSDAPSCILRIWQELLAFHRREDRSNAFLKADLERLEYARTISTHPRADSLYLQTLAEMESQYLSSPMVIEVMAAEANALIQGGLLPSRTAGNEKAAKEQALSICEKGLRLYPKYARINLLRQIIQTIKAPSFRCEFPATLYPGDTLSIKTHSVNLPEATVFIYRIGLSHTAYKNLPYSQRTALPKKLVYRETYALPCDLVSRDSIFKIPGLSGGLFEVEIQAPGLKEKLTQTLVCTRLFATAQYLNGQTNIIVSDWQSGQPVPKATLLLGSRSHGRLRTDTLYTDVRGRIRQHTGEGRISYEAVNAGNPAGNVGSLYPPYLPSENQARLYIVTDRKIYRPGQTVCFKGFVWKETPDEVHALNKKNLDILLRDANGKEIAKRQATSNRFGTFSGSFVLPAQTLNGRFTLSHPLYSADISVADYKRPEFEISFVESGRIHYAGDTVRLQGKVNSYAGPALSHATVKYNISRHTLYASSRNPGDLQGITATNSKGEFELSFPTASSHEARTSMYIYHIEASVSDAKGETQQASKEVPVYPAKDPRLLLELPYRIDKARKTAFYITQPDLPRQGEVRTIAYTLSKLTAPARPGQPLDSTVEKTVFSGKTEMGARDSLFPALQDQASGAYLFSVRCGKAKADRIFLLYSSKDRRPPIPTYDWSVEEKTACSPGDTARVQFGTSATDARVMYAIYTRHKQIKENTVLLSNEIINIDIPYKAEYGARIWLNIRYVKDKQYIDRTIPISRILSSKELHVRTSVFRDKSQPGVKEEWEVEVLSDKNEVVEAEVLALMYDASLDRLASNPIALYPRYYSQRFPYPWNHPYATDMTNYGNLSPWAFKRENRTVPPFRFNALNLYGSEFPQAKELLSLTTKCSVTQEAQLEEPAPAVTDRVNGKANALYSRKAEDSTAGNVPTAINPRKEFQETAFFYPHLRTDSSGKAAIRFTLPESLTKWKFIALATTPDMAAGRIEHTVTTSKTLMVRPYLPRFFRSGDFTILKAVVDNLSDSVCRGVSTLEFFNPANNQPLFTKTQPFHIPAGKRQTLAFPVDVPKDTDLAGIRITARSGLFSDGEQHLVAVLPDETLLTETLPLFADSAGSRRYSLKKSSPGKRNYRLTVEMAANPIWYAVSALPSLSEPLQENATDISASYYVNTLAGHIARSCPQIAEVIRYWSTRKNDMDLRSKLEQNQELKSLLLEASPWVAEAQNESERMQRLEQLSDRNRLNYLQQQAIDKLAALQTETGGWSWFKGMPASPFITLNVLELMHRAAAVSPERNSDKEKQMQLKALHYIDNTLMQELRIYPKGTAPLQILYLYVRSLYRDIPLGKVSEKHQQLLSLVRKQWYECSLYEKALAGIALKNYGFTKDAQDILKSLRQYAVDTPEGMCWPENKSHGFRNNSAVRVHTVLMEAFRCIEGPSAGLDRMKQWLLAQKRVQSWGSVPATVDAVHALLSSGSDWTAQPEQIEIKLGKHSFSTGTEGRPTGYFKASFPAEQIKPDMLTVEMTKHSDCPSWGVLYLQYFESLDRVKEQKTALSVKKELFLSQTGKNGRTELLPLQRQPLQTGDRVIVRLTLALKQDMEFLHLQDLRAACLEPAEQLSGNRWAFGTVYYQETKDAVTNFFFNALARGTYIIEYPLWVSHTGSYQDGTATLQCMYAPEYSAHSSTCRISVQE